MTSKRQFETPRRRDAEKSNGGQNLGPMHNGNAAVPKKSFPRRLGASAFSHYWQLPVLLLALLPQALMATSPATESPTVEAVPAEKPLGRLFFTPEERVALDRQRLSGMAESGNILKVNGVARNRATGRSTVWIDGKPWYEAEKLTGVSPSAHDASRVAVETAKGPPLSLKVGDSTNRVTGEIQGRLGDGRLVVHGMSKVKGER